MDGIGDVRALLGVSADGDGGEERDALDHLGQELGLGSPLMVNRADERSSGGGVAREVAGERDEPAPAGDYRVAFAPERRPEVGRVEAEEVGLECVEVPGDEDSDARRFSKGTP